MTLKANLSKIIVIALTSTLLFFSACIDDDQITNTPPKVTITSPEDGARFTPGETITIAVKAEDKDNNLVEVRFYVNDTKIGSARSFPYMYDWNTSGKEFGSFTIKAEAIDEAEKISSDETRIILESSVTVTDIEGNVYNVVIIGNQEWMGENLKTTTYNDGTSIDLVTDNAAWENRTTGAYCWYDHDKDQYAETYGALYNWYAVNTDNLCPDGWHVPTDEEWKTLEMELGMSQEEADSIGWRGTNEGSKLAGNASLWANGRLINNSEFGKSGFTALPAGYRIRKGQFYNDNIGNYGVWWSATEKNTENAYNRFVNCDTTQVHREDYQKQVGISIRCLKD